MKKEYDPLYHLEQNKFAKKHKEEMFNDTIYYQKKFGFEKSSDPAHSTWNNEADAFKHAYMQAWYTYLWHELIAEKFAGIHERNGNLYMGQPGDEENMDLWNNDVGRKIGRQFKNNIKGVEKYFTKRQLKDMVATYVMQSMKQGKLITHPSDKRRYIPPKAKGTATGGAANINNKFFTREQIGAMSGDDFNTHEKEIMQQLKNGQIRNAIRNYAGYRNRDTSTNHIYTSEEIGSMSRAEYDEHEKSILAQMETIGVPTNAELSDKSVSAGVVYVHPYERSDGTPVKGHYRSLPD